MEIVYPPINERDRLETPHQGEDFTHAIGPRPEANILAADKSDEKYGSDVSPLLEENARLRGLVVKLSSMILKNVVDQK